MGHWPLPHCISLFVRKGNGKFIAWIKAAYLVGLKILFECDTAPLRAFGSHSHTYTFLALRIEEQILCIWYTLEGPALYFRDNLP